MRVKSKIERRDGGTGFFMFKILFTADSSYIKYAEEGDQVNFELFSSVFRSKQLLLPLLLSFAELFKLNGFIINLSEDEEIINAI